MDKFQHIKTHTCFLLLCFKEFLNTGPYPAQIIPLTLLEVIMSDRRDAHWVQCSLLPS